MARHRHIRKIDPAFPLWQIASDDVLAAEVGSPVLARDGSSLSVVDPVQDVQSGGDFRDAQLLLEGAEIELMDRAVVGGPPGFPLAVSVCTCLYVRVIGDKERTRPVRTGGNRRFVRVLCRRVGRC